LTGSSVTHRLVKIVKVMLSVPTALVSAVLFPYMVPMATVGPFVLTAHALGFMGGYAADEFTLVGAALGGTGGLIGFWLWVFTDERRSVRMQRWMALLWLAGAAALTPYLPLVTFPPVGFSAWGFFSTLVVIVAATLFALWLFASTFFERRGRADLQSRK
jgi:hypothetical protein